MNAGPQLMPGSVRSSRCLQLHTHPVFCTRNAAVRRGTVKNDTPQVSSERLALPYMLPSNSDRSRSPSCSVRLVPSPPRTPVPQPPATSPEATAPRSEGCDVAVRQVTGKAAATPSQMPTTPRRLGARTPTIQASEHARESTRHLRLEQRIGWRTDELTERQDTYKGIMHPTKI